MTATSTPGRLVAREHDLHRLAQPGLGLGAPERRDLVLHHVLIHVACWNHRQLTVLGRPAAARPGIAVAACPSMDAMEDVRS